MDGDPDTILAYYMFVEHGWSPSQFDSLPRREKILVSLFAQKEVEERKKRLEAVK